LILNFIDSLPPSFLLSNCVTSIHFGNSFIQEKIFAAFLRTPEKWKGFLCGIILMKLSDLIIKENSIQIDEKLSLDCKNAVTYCFQLISELLRPTSNKHFYPLVLGHPILKEFFLNFSDKSKKMIELSELITYCKFLFLFYLFLFYLFSKN